MRSQSMHEAYQSLLTELYHSGETEINTRTGVGIKMLDGGHSFKLDLSNGRIPIAGNRRYWPRVAAAETAWQFMGTQSPDWILSKAPKIWQDFVEDGKLKTAYGYRWRRHFGRDQLALAMFELISNPTNRQLYISAWDPSSDGLGGPQPKNIPCPVGFSLTRVGEYINCSVFIRSSDVFVGLPYDVMGYALTLDAVAATVGCNPGTLHVTLAHPHYYDPHAEYVKDCIIETDTHDDRSDWFTNVEPSLPGWTVAMIENDPDGYVDQVSRLSNRVDHNPWNPMPELII